MKLLPVHLEGPHCPEACANITGTAPSRGSRHTQAVHTQSWSGETAAGEPNGGSRKPVLLSFPPPDFLLGSITILAVQGKQERAWVLHLN